MSIDAEFGCGKYFGCYKFPFEGGEGKGCFFMMDDAYDVFLLREETDEVRGSQKLNKREVDHVPFLYLDRTQKKRVELSTKLTGIYVVHYEFFKARKISFRKGYADIYGIEICRERLDCDPVSLSPRLFPVNLYDDMSPVVNMEHMGAACNVNDMHAQYSFRDLVAHQFTKMLFKSEVTRDVKFDVSVCALLYYMYGIIAVICFNFLFQVP